MQCACIGISLREIKTEADINDHKPNTGMFAVCYFLSV